MDTFSPSKLWLLIIFLLSSCSAASQSSIHLEPLGEVVIPYNDLFEGTPVGGLSGLGYEPSSGKYYVISDDRSELADARFYSFQVQLDKEGKLTENGIKLEEATFLKTPRGEHFALGAIDPEGIAISPDSLIYISSEGGRNFREPPFVNAYHKDGTYVKSLHIPEMFWAVKKADSNKMGMRTNLAFESLTITPDGKTLYTATENALMQDGPAADTVSSSPSRIIEYNMASGKITHEYRYDVDKVFLSEGKRGPFAVNGLSDLLALNNEGKLLALDRNYVQQQGNHILLYEVKTKGATDIKDISNMEQYGQPITPVTKTLVADLSTFNITIDNFEGLALGPELPGGGRLLLLVSDNNFSDLQKTVFTAFKLKWK